MIELLKTDLPTHYGLHRSKSIEVPVKDTSDNKFDLADSNEIIVPYDTGNVSLEVPQKAKTEVISYERYLNGLSGTAFERGRKRCDFILYEKDGETRRFFILNEQTSTLGSTDLLSKPIMGKRKNGQSEKEVLYPGGKYEKVEVQLAEALQTLIAVPSIASFINESGRKVCLMSYVITPRTFISAAQNAFTTRYRQVEARETGENGALLVCPSLNTHGFEYRRISHDYTFQV